MSLAAGTGLSLAYQSRVTQRVETCRHNSDFLKFSGTFLSTLSRTKADSSCMVAIVSSYSDAECALIARVEKKMELMMSKYDPSHDAHHGQ